MRKITSAALGVLFIVAAFTSCKKIKDAIFSGVDVDVPAISLSVPAVPVVIPFEVPFPSYNQNFNLDSAIKANTGGAFGVGAVSSIKVKTVAINVPDADENNNLSNFNSARVMITSNSESNPAELFNVTFPTTYTASLTITPTNGVELLPYFKGGQLTYTLYGSTRKITTKQLTMKMSVVMTVK